MTRSRWIVLAVIALAIEAVLVRLGIVGEIPKLAGTASGGGSVHVRHRRAPGTPAQEDVKRSRTVEEIDHVLRHAIEREVGADAEGLGLDGGEAAGGTEAQPPSAASAAIPERT